MKKTWAEIRNEVINLGFEKAKAYEKNKTAFVEAFNWAQNFIASTVSPIVDSVTIKQKKSENPYNRYDLWEITAFKGERVYIEPANEKPIISNLDMYRVVDDYLLEQNRYILFKGEYEGDIKVFYNKYPQVITLDTADNYLLEIDFKYCQLLPYLMANRLWLDDDLAKATLYWNLYEDMKNQLEMSKLGQVTATVITPPIWLL